MRAGKLDRKIDIERLTQGEANIYNEPEEKSWSPLHRNVWASVRPLAGKEALEASALVASDILVFRIRFQKDVRPEDRIVYNNRVYQIIKPPAEIGRRVALDITAEGKDNHGEE